MPVFVSKHFRRSVVGLALACALAATATHALSASADERYAQRLGELVNDHRASRGAAELVVDSGLAALAREHSESMARAKRMSHDGFQSRFSRSGYGLCVENVGWNYRVPQRQLDAWRASPGHERNLLDPRLMRMGAGEASGYVTWIACR